MKLLRTVLLGALALSVPALAGGDKYKDKQSQSGQVESEVDSSYGGSGQVGQQAKTPPAAGKDWKAMKLNYDEKGLVQRLHDLNQSEISLAQVAKSKATLQQTKDLADLIVKEHTDADQKLTQLAEKNGWKLTKPTPADDKERKWKAHVDSTTAALQNFEGPMFDSVYLSSQVALHDKAVKIATVGQKQFTANKELSGHLAEIQPKLIQHRQQAYQALGQLKIEQQLEQPGVGGAGFEGGKFESEKSEHEGHDEMKGY